MRRQKPFPAELMMLLAAAFIILVLILLYFRYAGQLTGSSNPDTTNQQTEQQTVNTAVHIVQPGETLIMIADRYGIGYADIVAANDIANPDNLLVGETLTIPYQDQAQNNTQNSAVSSDLTTTLLPDSKVVYSPAGRDFNIGRFISDAYTASTLNNHSEQVEGRILGGVGIVQLAAERTRVDPRVLLAALETRSSWITQSNSGNTYPLGYQQPGYEGLYKQLEWAGNQINQGYYGRTDGGLTGFQLVDGTRLDFAAASSAGTSGLLYWLGRTAANQTALAQESGRFIAVYEQLFGDPAAGDVSSFYPDNLTQPTLRLPWEDGDTWYLTGGPHGGWAAGSAWAALDFAPSDAVNSCDISDMWVVAVADGVITRSDAGAIVLDLDGDGYAGTGWVVLYQHVAAQDRSPVGSRVRVGDRIGRASCEGGVSTATHLHIARTYNGRWISADQNLPFNLGGWVSQGDGDEYNGRLVRGDQTRTATVGRFAVNGITAP